jgi:hypothetical protein
MNNYRFSATPWLPMAITPLPIRKGSCPAPPVIGTDNNVTFVTTSPKKVIGPFPDSTFSSLTHIVQLTCGKY